ncbi:hypothetical protein BpHYR1_039433 [Brachionus plicatilis]|uniref:Uncharacterized protein n=1 Tax=Brachionus plicatilis TaxID=10195 RepID=A0A3M7T4I9_BRAPC|nr:hypothetical protein BpHYR1_039433 [Brachionus plicatilis]
MSQIELNKILKFFFYCMKHTLITKTFSCLMTSDRSFFQYVSNQSVTDQKIFMENYRMITKLKNTSEKKYLFINYLLFCQKLLLINESFDALHKKIHINLIIVYPSLINFFPFFQIHDLKKLNKIYKTVLSMINLSK